jgi:hypothetical protein
MSSLSIEQESYRIAGQALASAQMFETMFVIAAKLAIQQQNAVTLEDIVPLSTAKSFKQPIKAVLQELGKAQSIAATLEDRIAILIEERHRLVHRAHMEFGWPGFSTEMARVTFSELCDFVTRESIELAIQFHTFILEWLRKFPEMADTVRRQELAFGVTSDQIKDAAALIRGA